MSHTNVPGQPPIEGPERQRGRLRGVLFVLLMAVGGGALALLADSVRGDVPRRPREESQPGSAELHGSDAAESPGPTQASSPTLGTWEHIVWWDDGELLASFGSWIIPVLQEIAERHGDEYDMRGVRSALVLTLVQRRLSEVTRATRQADVMSVDYPIETAELDHLIRAFRDLPGRERIDVVWEIDRLDLRARWGLYSAGEVNYHRIHLLRLPDSAGETERTVWCEIVAPVFRRALTEWSPNPVGFGDYPRSSLIAALVFADCEPQLDPDRIVEALRALEADAWRWLADGRTILARTGGRPERRERYLSPLVASMPCDARDYILYKLLLDDADALLLLEYGVLGDLETNYAATCADFWCRPRWEESYPESYADCLALVGASVPPGQDAAALSSEACRVRPIERTACLAFVEELLAWRRGDRLRD